MKALIGFKSFYFFGSVSVRFRCVCEMAFTYTLTQNENFTQYSKVYILMIK